MTPAPSTEHLFSLLNQIRSTTSTEEIGICIIPPTEQHTETNYCFLDAQNLYQGIKERGWKINWYSFRQYLHKKYNVVKAVVFIGFVKGNEWLYTILHDAGFELEFKETRILRNGQLDNGNCD